MGILQKIEQWLAGKKTMIVAILTAVGAGMTAYGITIPEWIWILLAGAGLGAVRSAVGKLNK